MKKAKGSINTTIEEAGGSRDGEKKTLSWCLWIPIRACLAFQRAKLIAMEPIIFFFMFASFLRTTLYLQYYYVSYGTVLLQNTSFPFPKGSFCLNSSEVDEYAGNGSYKAVETWSDNLVVYGELASHVPSIIITILLGPLSDRYGRKPVLLLAGFGSVIEGIIAILIFYLKLSPYYIIAAYFVTGLSGSFTGVLAASFSYIADVSSAKWRGFRIGVLEACFSIGVACGQFSVGFWLQRNNCDFIQPMWLYTACNIVVIFYTAVCIPESLSKRERMENAEKTSTKGFKSLVRGIKIFTPGVEPHYVTWKLWAATVVAGVMVFDVAGSTFISVYFLKAPPFDLDALMIGVYQSVQHVSKALANTMLMAIFSAMKIPEAAIAIIAVLFSSGCNLLIGFSSKLWQLLAVASVQGVESISWTALRTLMSKLVAPEDTGSMFAILASAESLFALISSVAWPNIYNIIINNNFTPGTTYKIMAGGAITTLLPLVALLVFRKIPKSTSHENGTNPEKDSLLQSAESQAANGHIVVPAYGNAISSSS